MSGGSGGAPFRIRTPKRISIKIRINAPDPAWSSATGSSGTGPCLAVLDPVEERAHRVAGQPLDDDEADDAPMEQDLAQGVTLVGCPLHRRFPFR
jgi:hypothetical protein